MTSSRSHAIADAGLGAMAEVAPGTASQGPHCTPSEVR